MSGRALFVANSGGHLNELLHLSRRLPMDITDELWVTFDGPQSRSLLAGRNVHYVRYSAPRDAAATLANAAKAARLLARQRFDWAFSTGATVAVSFLPLARARGIPSYYIESATRVDGPSLTGRILSWVPGIRKYTQYHGWASVGWAESGWAYCGSVFDGFEVSSASRGAAVCSTVRRVVVTVGASEVYGFRRLVERLLSLLPASAEVLWQTGRTDVADLGIAGRQQVPAGELAAAMRDADLVVAHAGVGSALTALECGKRPVLVPREPEHGEHVDAHQFQVATALASRGLAIARSVEELTYGDLADAAISSVSQVADAPPLILDMPSVASARRQDTATTSVLVS